MTISLTLTPTQIVSVRGDGMQKIGYNMRYEIAPATGALAPLFDAATRTHRDYATMPLAEKWTRKAVSLATSTARNHIYGFEKIRKMSFPKFDVVVEVDEDADITFAALSEVAAQIDTNIATAA